MFEGIVHTSCHDDLLPGTIVRSETVEDYDSTYKWMVVQLPSGINRDVLVKEIKQVSSFGVIKEQTPEKCDLCSKIEECRPYGSNGEKVCFDCGMKNPEAAKRGFEKLVLGEGNDNAQS